VAETVLVTGGTGYVGSWCVVELLKRGYDVRTTVRSLRREQAVRDAVASQVDPDNRLRVVQADLTGDDGWAAAMAGVDYVLHVASPLGNDNPKDPDELIVPARDGTVRVLRAATEAGVRRVVLTSSGAAATPAATGAVSIDDQLWTDPDQPGLTAYRKSKVLAERAAWDFMAEHGGVTELVTVLPGAIFGPALPGVSQSSTAIIGRMLSGRMRAVPRIEMAVSDVRDLADLHIRAMTEPAAAGQRFLGTSDVLSIQQMATALRAELGVAAPTRTMPDLALRLVARFNPQLRVLLPLLGRRLTASSQRARSLLGWQPRPAPETVVDTGRYLLAEAG